MVKTKITKHTRRIKNRNVPIKRHMRKVKPKIRVKKIKPKKIKPLISMHKPGSEKHAMDMLMHHIKKHNSFKRRGDHESAQNHLRIASLHSKKLMKHAHAKKILKKSSGINRFGGHIINRIRHAIRKIKRLGF